VQHGFEVAYIGRWKGIRMNQETISKEQQEFTEALIEFEKAEAPQPKTLNDLSWIAREIKALRNRISMTEQYRAAEIEKIASCAGAIIEKREEQVEKLTVLAMNFLKSEGYCYADKKLRSFELAGIGKFAFSTSRESVNADDYNDMTIKQKDAWHKKRPEFTISKLSISPVKSAIMTAMTEGKEVPGFSINHKHETFKFKAE